MLRQTQLTSNLPFHVKPIIDIADQLPKHPNGGWAKMPLRRADGSVKSGLRSPNEVTYISVHHTAVNGTPEGHARYHIGKGDGGIAYHLLIEKDQTFQVNDLLALTWHTASNNYHTVSVCVEGDFTKRNLTEAERNNLYAAIITLMEIFNIPLKNVLGHKEFPSQSTACPGFDMNRVRKDIAEIELDMSLQNSPNDRLAQIFAFHARYTDLYKKAGDPNDKFQAAAQSKLMEIIKIATEKGYYIP